MAEKRTVPGADFIKEELKNGVSGAYFFYGEEDYMQSHYLHEIEKATVGDRTSLNFIRITNDESSPGALEEALSSAPMGDMFSIIEGNEDNNLKLIELYEVDFKALKPNDLKATVKLIEGIDKSEVLLVIYSTEAELPHDSRAHQAIIKDLSKVAVPVEFKVETDARLASWISKMAAKSSVLIENDVARFLIDRVGHSMFILKNEVEKLTSYVQADGRHKVERDDIKNISVTNKEISPFDFTNALMRRDAKAAFYILADMKSRGEEPGAILFTVSRVVGELILVRGSMDLGLTRAEAAKRCNMHEYKVKLYSEVLTNTDISKLFSISKAVYDADIMLKSSSVDNFTVIERLICILCDRSQ
jgi:DNA polymerase III delta subunit